MPVTSYISVGGRMISEVTDGVILDYVPDALGSIHSVIDQDHNVVKTMRYKPYGEVLSRSGTVADRHYQWVGSYGYRATFAPSSSHYVRARHYSAAAGSWSTVDPLVPRQPAYRYVRGRPTRNTDPQGLCDPATACADYLKGTVPDKHDGFEIGNGDLIKPGSTITGFLLCCDGKFVRCTTPSGNKNAIAAKCTKEHEGVHEADVTPCPKCTGGAPTRPGFSPITVGGASECRAHQQSLRCVQKACDPKTGTNKGTNDCAALYPATSYVRGHCNRIKDMCAKSIPKVDIDPEIIKICQVAGISLP
jgi:RHS repeat-associated protein